MKKHIIQFKKIFIISAIIFVAITLSLFMYIENGALIYFSKTERKKLVEDIQKSPDLPANFFDFYQSVYPNAIENSFWKKSFKTFTSPYHVGKNELPSQNIANMFIGSFNKSNSDGKRNYIFLTRFIEQNFTQKKCINYYFQNFDFLYNRKGINSVSQDLFKKELKDLAPVEIAEIVALSENPVKNNRFRNPKNAKLSANVFLKKYRDFKAK